MRSWILVLMLLILVNLASAEVLKAEGNNIEVNLVGGKDTFNIVPSLFGNNQSKYNDFLESTVLSWTCDSNVMLLFSSESCYCFDTKPDDGVSDGVGYGDLAKCVKKSNGVMSVMALSSSHPKEVFDFTITYNVSTRQALSPVTIVSSSEFVDRNEYVSCEEQGALPAQPRYAFYRTSPFGIVYRGEKKNISLSNSRIYLYAGDEIKCQLLSYNEDQFMGSSLSSNSVRIKNTNVSARWAYSAPAYPTILDTIYCYGYALQDVSGSVNHRFQIFRNGALALDSNYNSPDSVNWQNLSLSSFSKGDNVSCRYTVSWGTNTSSYDTSFVVRNTKPTKPEVTITYVTMH